MAGKKRPRRQRRASKREPTPKRDQRSQAKAAAPTQPQDRLIGLDILFAAGQQTQSSLDQDLKQRYGVLSALVDKKLADCMGEELDPNSDMAGYKDAFVVLALEAAILDPRLFRHFTVLYARGPGGSFAKRSTTVEPLSRPDFDLIAFEWRHAMANAALPPAVRLFNMLALMANSLEFRIRPFLFALAYLLDVVTEAKACGSPSTLSDAEVNARFKKHFFEEADEYWGTERVKAPTTRSIRTGASTVLRKALEHARTASSLDTKRLDLLDSFRASLLNDETPPSKQVPGQDYRYGLSELRNQLNHANLSFLSDRIRFGHSAVYWDFLDEVQSRSHKEVRYEQLEIEVSRLEGLMCLIRAWETTLNNIESWLSQWGVGEPVPFPKNPEDSEEE